MPFGAIAGAIGLGSSLFGGLFGASASRKASRQYIQALQQAQQYLSGELNQGLGNYAPYLSAGSHATNLLSSMLSTPGQGLLTPWTNTFRAPTLEEARSTPGYQFQLEQGENAIQNSAAGRGSLLSGRTLADVNNYAQGLADTSYNDVFNRSLTQYQQAYQSFLNNQNNTYNRLLGLSGEGLSAAGGAGNLISGIGGDIASLMSRQGAARAGGTLGSANSILGMIPGLSGGLLQLLGGLFGRGGGGGGAVPNMNIQPGFGGVG